MSDNKKTHMEKLEEFHRKFHGDITLEEAQAMRYRLFNEEANEVLDSLENDNLPEDREHLAKELGDAAYVLYGTAYLYGIDLDAVIEKNHESNLSKVGEDGEPIFDETGKPLKGERYFDPNLEDTISDMPDFYF